jgi:hypothetical protein
VFQTARKGQCDPNNSDVNFAVPSEQILRKFNPYRLSGSKRYPGIYRRYESRIEGTLTNLIHFNKVEFKSLIITSDNLLVQTKGWLTVSSIHVAQRYGRFNNMYFTPLNVLSYSVSNGP